MGRHVFPLELSREEGGPLYLRIANSVIDAVRCGRLRSGDAIPGTRILAEELGVHRNTVKAAYAQLTAQGWINTRPSSGTFVSDELPDRFSRRPSRRPAQKQGARGDVVGFDVPVMELPPEDTWSEEARAPLSFIGMDARLMPLSALARAYRRALASRDNVLGYRIDHGHPRFLAALREMLASTRGVPHDHGLLVTRGSQMGLYLVIRALLRPGDCVAVEDPGYAFSWPAFRHAGVKLLPIPVDARGLDVEHLARVVEREQVRAVLVTPHMQYPTGVALAAGRRMALTALARKRRFAIIEDDWVHEVRYEGRPILPLISADSSGVTIYLGSFSKIFAPALRMGFVVAPAPFVARLARIRPLIDVCGDGALELAMAELLEEGEIQRHVRRLTRAYRSRRNALMDALTRHLSSVVSFEQPRGGTSLWACVDSSVDVDAWAQKSLAEGVGFLTGRAFAFDGKPRQNLWLGFASLDEHQLEEAVRRMAKALPRGPKQKRPRATCP